MKTPDEIKKGLECCRESQDCTQDNMPKCPYYEKETCLIELVDDALALIRQLEARVPRWISVEEEVKPKLHQECLCICSYKGTVHHEWDYMMVLRWMGNCNNGYADRPHFQHEGMNDMIVTHWMPLPEPPET